MKYIPVMLAFVIAGCDAEAPIDTDPIPQATTVDSVALTQSVDATLSGLYQTTLPCDDCEGRQHVLFLYPTGTFRLEEKLIGKSTLPSITFGQWWRNENEIQLLNGNIVLYTYQLQDNKLYLVNQLADVSDETLFLMDKLDD